MHPEQLQTVEKEVLFSRKGEYTLVDLTLSDAELSSNALQDMERRGHGDGSVAVISEEEIAVKPSVLRGDEADSGYSSDESRQKAGSLSDATDTLRRHSASQRSTLTSNSREETSKGSGMTKITSLVWKKESEIRSSAEKVLPRSSQKRTSRPPLTFTKEFLESDSHSKPSAKVTHSAILSSGVNAKIATTTPAILGEKNEPSSDDDMVYALYRNTQSWHIGRIKKKTAHGYNILFLDGDFQSKTSRKDFLTKAEAIQLWGIKYWNQRVKVDTPAKVDEQPSKRYKRQRTSSDDADSIQKRQSTINMDSIKKGSYAQSLDEWNSNPPDFSVLKGGCGKCVRCVSVVECGKCKACMENLKSTRSDKETCLRKMCVAGNSRDRAIDLPFGLKFFFDGGLPGLNLFWEEDADTTFTTVHDALASRGLHEDIEAALTNCLYEDLLGEDTIGSACEHYLIGKTVAREWIDASFRKRILCGIVKSCREDCDGDKSLEIEYAEPSVEFVQRVVPGSTIKPMAKVDEYTAFGTRLLYEQKTGGESSLQNTFFPVLRWIVPECVDDNPIYPPTRTLTFKNVVIELEARQSLIPGSGFGVFARVVPVFDQSLTSFILEPGELLDLGIYGPLCKEDIVDPIQLLTKTFIHSGKPEEWTFEDSSKNYDITDDLTGDLSPLAKRNVLVYVNETAGEKSGEKASIQAKHDPIGHVHYMLGPEPFHARLTLPVGVWVELKIDYGKEYEPVRIRKGYSRLEGEELVQQQYKVEQEDKTTIRDTENWSVDEVEKSLKFVQRLPWNKMEEKPRVRCLVMAISLCNRLVAVREEFDGIDTSDPSTFCDNGFTTMESKGLVRLALALIKELLQHISDDDLRNTFHNDPMHGFGNVLASFYSAATGNKFPRSGSSIRGLIQQTVDVRLQRERKHLDASSITIL